jgi:tetratricopeptide (TPR) repeat protein
MKPISASAACALILAGAGLNACSPASPTIQVPINTTLIQASAPPSSAAAVANTPLFDLSQLPLSRKVVTLQDEDYELFFLLGPNDQAVLDAVQTGEFEKAKDLLQKSQAVSGPNQRFDLATLQLARGQVSDALGQFSSLESVVSGKWVLLANRAIAHLQLGLYDQAQADLNEVIRQRSGEKAAYYHRGLLQLRLDKLAEALDSLNLALKQDRNYVPALSRRGGVYLRQNQADKALEDLNRALQLNPNYAPALNGRGLAYLKLNQLEQALSDFDLALKLRPAYSEALLNRSLVHIRRNELGKGAQDAASSLQSLSGNQTSLVEQTKTAFVYENLAWIHLLQQDWNAAADLASQALLKDPQAVPAQINRAHALLYRGDKLAALKAYQEVISRVVDGKPVTDIIQQDWLFFLNKGFPGVSHSEIAQELGFKTLLAPLLSRSLLPSAQPLPGNPLLPGPTPTPIPTATPSALSGVEGPTPSPTPFVQPTLRPTSGSGTGGSTFSATYNALNELPEVVQVTPARNGSGVDPKTSFVLKFSEPMERKSIEDTFSIRSFNSRKLTVDTGNLRISGGANTLTGNGNVSLLEGTPIYDKSAFHVAWNSDDTEVTFSFKEEFALPTDKDSNLVPDYRVAFQSLSSGERTIRDKVGWPRPYKHFKLTDGDFEESYKFSIKSDEVKPSLSQIFVQSAETGGKYGDAIAVRYSERMIFYTQGQIIAGGMAESETNQSWKQAPAGYPGNGGLSTPERAAENYHVTLTPAGYVFPLFEGAWSELGGGVYYDPGDPTGKTVLLITPPGLSLFRPGDLVKVTLSATILDPAGNSVDTSRNSRTGVAG